MEAERCFHQGPVARSLVSANHWLRGIKMYRFPWYLTLVSTNHASSNLGQIVNSYVSDYNSDSDSTLSLVKVSLAVAFMGRVHQQISL